MKSKPVDLIASYHTLAGDVPALGAPGDDSGKVVERDFSKFDFRRRMEVASKVGYTGAGLSHPDLVKVASQYGYGGIKSILADNGIVNFEFEFIIDWFADGERRRRSDQTRGLLLGAAEAIGARHIKVGGDMNGESWPVDLLTASFAALCDDATNAGTNIVIEILPWSNFYDIDSALKIVARAGKPNGGLCVDIWHLARRVVAYEEIGNIPKQYLKHVEVDDADQTVVGSLFEDSARRRKLCGDGNLNVRKFLSVVKASGYDGPIGVEIISDEHMQRSLEEAAEQSFRTAMREFEAA
jgi:sugar phosphate isomerase/epimerase